MESFSDMPYDEMIVNNIVRVGTPADVIERSSGAEALRRADRSCDYVNPGGVEHWKTIKIQEIFARHVYRTSPEISGRQGGF
jgi:hypothetical protein